MVTTDGGGSMNQDPDGAVYVREQMMQIASAADLDPDAKLFSLCLLAFLADQHRAGHRGGDWAAAVGAMMSQRGIDRSVQDSVSLCRSIIAKDIPRYEVPALGSERLRCAAPRARGRRAGMPCGNPTAGAHFIDYDPVTGEGTWIAYCGKHSHPALDEQRRLRYRAWVDNGRPTPAPNTGGLLPRYFHADWSAVYRWADPERRPAPRWHPPGPPRPHLTLISGGLARSAPCDGSPLSGAVGGSGRRRLRDRGRGGISLAGIAPSSSATKF